MNQIKKGQEYWDLLEATAKRVNKWPSWKTGQTEKSKLTKEIIQHKNNVISIETFKNDSKKDGSKITIQDVLLD